MADEDSSSIGPYEVVDHYTTDTFDNMKNFLLWDEDTYTELGLPYIE